MKKIKIPDTNYLFNYPSFDYLKMLQYSRNKKCKNYIILFL